MYVRRLHVQNLKRLRDFQLDLRHAGRPRMWTVLIGENGTAKTTLLQAIALAATGSRQVNTIAGPVVKHLCDRRRDARLEIDVEFEFTPSASTRDVHPLLSRPPKQLGLRSHVSLESGSTSLAATATYQDEQGKLYEELHRKGSWNVDRPLDPLDHAREKHTRLWFVAGYGISRALPDATSTPSFDRPSIERMQPLFDTQARLASTSFSNHFAAKDREENRRKGDTSRLYSRMLNDAIKIGGSELLPHITKLELRGQGRASTATDLIESDRFHQKMGRHVHSSSPVEHYRPKAGAGRHDRGTPSRVDDGHYWWLTWT